MKCSTSLLIRRSRKRMLLWLGTATAVSCLNCCSCRINSSSISKRTKTSSITGGVIVDNIDHHHQYHLLNRSLIVSSAAGRRRTSCGHPNPNPNPNPNWLATNTGLGFIGATAALIIIMTFSADLASSAVAAAPPKTGRVEDSSTLSNIPQTLSGECLSTNNNNNDSDCKKKGRIQHPKSRKAESCTGKCVTTCIRGGSGEGPLNVRRPLVVFKQGFRSRQYCLVECSDICNLIKDDEDDGLVNY